MTGIPLAPRCIGPFAVSAIGLGCMNLSHAYGVPPTPEVGAKILRRAVELGVTHFDTAALYGFGANEELLGLTLAGFRERFTLASKCGMQGVKTDSGSRRVIDGRPDTLRRTCEDSLRRLAQLALAWLLTRGTHVIAIPGTTSITHLEENVEAGEVTLSSDMTARLDLAINHRRIVGDRYNSATQAEIDTEDFS
jgi:aryl-alcohol dehydrogenase-like predicted oxidoreductase